MNSPSVIVIGAGIGGICAATHLARQGMRVTVVEKNQGPGGRCDQYVRDGHRFDTGPTLLIMPLVYEAEFAELGASLRERLDLIRIDPTYHLIFDDGSRFTLTSDMEKMRGQLESVERGSFFGLLRYLEEGGKHYEVGMEKLVNRDFRTASDFFSLDNVPLIYQLKPLVPHYQHMSSFFKNERLKAAFTFQDVYMGLSPFEAPATFSMMPFTELAHGVWYPRGGMYAIVEALMDIAREAGVEFIFRAPVKQIILDGDKVEGILLEDDRRMDADIVVANADLPYVFHDLLPDTSEAERLEHKQFSCSTISFFWGVDKRYPELEPHMLFLADDYYENFESITDDLSIPENPSLYIHAPARIDPTAAPEGQDTLIAVVPVGHMSDDNQQDWDDLRRRARESVYRRLALLGITDLQEHIKFEMAYTPVSWNRHYNLMKGATHGLSHTLKQLAYFRPHNRHPRYHNLYFVGASTHPGTGVPTALISGRLVAERVLEERGVEEKVKADRPAQGAAEPQSGLPRRVAAT